MDKGIFINKKKKKITKENYILGEIPIPCKCGENHLHYLFLEENTYRKEVIKELDKNKHYFQCYACLRIYEIENINEVWNRENVSRQTKKGI